jgi:DNA polymerase-3 subunit alpha
VHEDVHGIDALTTLREIVRGYPGTKPLRLRLELADGGCVTIDCPNSSVTIDPELRRRVDEFLGSGNFRLLSAPRIPAPHATNGRRRTLVRN